MVDFLQKEVHEGHVRYRVTNSQNQATHYEPGEFFSLLPEASDDNPGRPFRLLGETCYLAWKRGKNQDGNEITLISVAPQNSPQKAMLQTPEEFEGLVPSITPTFAAKGWASADSLKRQNEGKGGLKPGNLFHTKIALPDASFSRHLKIFVVKEAHGDGKFTAYSLTSNLKSADYAGSFSVNADEVNLLAQDSVVQVNREFDFPSSWPLVKMHGVLTPGQMTELMLLQETYKEKNVIEKFEVQHPLADDVEDIHRQVSEMLQGFHSDPAKLIDYLAFSSKFYQYSPRNQMLIYRAAPYSTFVASKSRFEKMGYKINPEAQRIPILRPQKMELFDHNGYLIPVSQATREEKQKIAQGKIEIVEKTHFQRMYVYDISQTSCPVKDYPKVYDKGYTSEQHAALFEQMKELSELSGVPVEIKDLASLSLGGFYHREENTITLNRLLQDTERLAVMCHEYSHALLHRTSTQSKGVREFEAQCLANMLQGRFGVPVSENNKEYMVKSYEAAQKDPKFKLDASLGRVQRQLRYIDKRIELKQELEEDLELEPHQPQNMNAKEPGFQPPHRGGGRT